MVKTIKLICIAGILALIVLFVIFTENGRLPKQKNNTEINEQAIKTDKTKKSVYENKRINTDTNVKSDIINMIINW